MKFFVSIFFVAAIINPVQSYSQNDTDTIINYNVHIGKADREFILVSSEIHKVLGVRDRSKKYTLDALENRISELQAINDNFTSVHLITANLKLIKNNLDHRALLLFINILLSNNDFSTASNLLQYIIKNSDKSLASNIKFSFAKYHLKKGNYAKSNELLTDITSDLSIDNGHYALIMKGIILQKKRKHRKSLHYYESVPATSKYYHYAQLNKAVAYIRQGWWSDAQLTINKLLAMKLPKAEKIKTINNRLLLVAGYSFLQQEYFRESREAFRNIDINSPYASRAMLGIALSAANQGDNTGALNILNILQKKSSHSLTVEETYLLLPYIYERVDQHKTAAASYQIGLAYYRKRIEELDALLLQIKKPNYLINGTNNDSLLKLNHISLQDAKSKNLMLNLRILQTFRGKAKNSSLKNKINRLIHNHQQLLKNIISKKIEERVAYLQSYKNQSQFGIARLYDNSRKNN